MCAKGKYSSSGYQYCSDCSPGFYLADDGLIAIEHDEYIDCLRCPPSSHSGSGSHHYYVDTTVTNAH